MKISKVLKIILLIFVMALTPLVLVACGDDDSSGSIQIDGNNAISVTVNNDSLKGKYNQINMSYDFVYGEEISLNYAEDFTVKLNYEDGTSKELVYQTDYSVELDLPANADVGTYSAHFQSNGYTANINITIKPKPVEYPTLSETNFIYNGNPQGPTIDYHGYENLITTTGDASATEKGSYSLSFALNSQNYEWKATNDPSQPSSLHTFYITENIVPLPTIAATDNSEPVNGIYELTWAYDIVENAVVARAQGITMNIPEQYSSIITVNGALTGTQNQQYIVDVFLNNSNYKFSDGSTSFQVEYKINKLALTKPLLTQTEYTYTGESISLSFDENFDANLMAYDFQSYPNITYDIFGVETSRSAISSYVYISSLDNLPNICWESETDCASYPVEYYISRDNNWLPSNFDQTKVELKVHYNKANDSLHSYIPMFDLDLLTEDSRQYLSDLDLFDDNDFYSWSEASNSPTLAMGDNAVTLIYSPHVNYYTPQSLTVNVKLEKAEVDMSNFAWNTITNEPYSVHKENGTPFAYKFMLKNDVTYNSSIDLDMNGCAINNPLSVDYYFSLEPFKTDNQFEDESAKSAYWTSCKMDSDYEEKFTHAGYYKVVYGNIDRDHYSYVQFDADNNKTEWTVPAEKEYSVAKSNFDLSSMNGTALNVASRNWQSFYFYSGGPAIDCLGSLFNYEQVSYSYYYSATSTADLNNKFENGETISTTDMKDRGTEDSGYLKVGYYKRIVTISYNKNDYNMTNLTNPAAVINEAEGKIVITTDFEVTKVRLVSQANPMYKLFCYENDAPLTTFERPKITLDDNYYENDRPYTNDKTADLYEKYDSATATWITQDKDTIAAVGKYRTSSVFTVNDANYYSFYDGGEEKSEITLVHEFEILETPFESITIAGSTSTNLQKALEKFKYSALLPIGKELSLTVKEGYKIDMTINGAVLCENQTSATFTYNNENKDYELSITIKDSADNVVLETQKTCLQLSSDNPFNGITINGTAVNLANNGTTILHWGDTLNFGKHEQFSYGIDTSYNQLSWQHNDEEMPYTFIDAASNSKKYLRVYVYYNSTTYGFESTALFSHLFEKEVFENLKINDVTQEVRNNSLAGYDYWYDKDTTTQIKINISQEDIDNIGTIYYSLDEQNTKQEMVGGEVILSVSENNTLNRLSLYCLDSTNNEYLSIGEVQFFHYEIALQSLVELKINNEVQTPTTEGTYEFHYSAETSNFNIDISADDVSACNGNLRYSVGFASEMLVSYSIENGSLTRFISTVTQEAINEGYIYYVDNETNTSIFIAKILLVNDDA